MNHPHVCLYCNAWTLRMTSMNYKNVKQHYKPLKALQSCWGRLQAKRRLIFHSGWNHSIMSSEPADLYVILDAWTFIDLLVLRMIVRIARVQFPEVANILAASWRSHMCLQHFLFFLAFLYLYLCGVASARVLTSVHHLRRPPTCIISRPRRAVQTWTDSSGSFCQAIWTSSTQFGAGE